jgi:hypothetical protein
LKLNIRNFATLSTQKLAVFSRRADDARLIHASITTLALWWASFQTPQFNDHPDRWANFSPWGAGFARS